MLDVVISVALTADTTCKIFPVVKPVTVAPVVSSVAPEGTSIVSPDAPKVNVVPVLG